MTLGTVIASIAVKLHDANNVVVTQPQIRAAVNESLKYWKRKGQHLWFNEFQETVTFQEGVPSFSLTTNTPLVVFDNIVIVDNTLRYQVLKVDGKTYDNENAEDSGRPNIWTYRNDGFEIYPYPDQDYSAVVRGIKEYDDFATDGTEDNSTNDWLDEAETLIEHDALSRCLMMYRDDFEKSQAYAASARDEFSVLNDLHTQRVKTGKNKAHTVLI